MKYGTQFNPYMQFTGLNIPNCIAQSDLKDAEKLLLGRLYQFAGKNGEAFPSRPRLAQELHWELGKLDRTISALKKHKLIKTYQVDEQSPSRYIFLYNKYYNPTVKNDSTPTVRNDNTPLVKNDKHNRIKKQRVKKQKTFSNEKERTDVRCNNQDDESLQESSSTPKKKITKIKKIANPFEGFSYSANARKIMSCWKNNGGMLHKIKTAKGIDLIDGMIFELLNDSFNPYHKLVDSHDDKSKQWTVQEIIACINHFAGVLKKDISKMYFSKFVITETYGKFRSSATNRNYSPIFEVSQVVSTEQPTKESLKLKKIFMNGTPVPETIFIRAANRVTVVAEKFKVTDASCESYRRNVLNVFVKYVKEKQNDKRFDIKFMCGDTFVDEFVKTMVKRNILIKKGKSTSFQVGRRVS